MEFVCTKNNMPDLFVFFKKAGDKNIHRPLLSMFKIDSATRTVPIFHIGFQENMGYLSSNKIVSGVMVFEVLEGYPLQEMMFNKPYSDKYFRKTNDRCLEDLDPMDFYCIQKNNKDAYGDFVLKNLKFIDTKMSQSAEDFSRRIIASFVCTSMENFRLPFFFNYFMSDDYDHHIIRDKSEIDNIKKDIKAFGDKLPKEVYQQCINDLNGSNSFSKEVIQNFTNDLGENISSLETIIILVDKVFSDIQYNWYIRAKHKKGDPIFKMRDFISTFYNYKNEYEYEHAQYRGDLEFLKIYRGEHK